MNQQAHHYVQTGKGTLKRVGNQMALYVGDRKAIHVLNATALLLYHCLAEPLTREELVAILTELNPPDADTLAADIERVLATLIDHDLVRIVECHRTP